jgi:hypothetical protein
MGRIDTDETNGRKAQGYAWASQAGAVLSNPFASELTRDSEIHRPLCYANGPAMFRQKSLGEKAGLRLVSKRGCVVKNICKPACERLFNNKSSIRTANQPRYFWSSDPCISW